MSIEKRRLCIWFEEKVKEKFEISDQDGNYLGEWTLDVVERTSPVKLVDGSEVDCYWLKFNTKEQWNDGLYLLKAEDGELVTLFANALSATEVQANVN